MIRRETLKRIAAPFRRTRGFLAMRLGRMASSKPLSRSWGRNRGEPIDRYFIASFIAEHAEDIHGRVLEVGDDEFSRRFGGSRVTRQDILNVKPSPAATIVGDVSQPGLLPNRAFDCIIFTQTLHLIFDMPAAIRQLHQALKPGGVLLISVPGITPVGQGEWKPIWLWSLTETALERLLDSTFEDGSVELRTYGNLRAASAFLHAASIQDIGRRALAPVDPAYPVIVTARAVA